jgi:hypothetical protein
VLTDEEVETIRRKLAEGWRGPVLLTWLEQLLQDREERRQRERVADQRFRIAARIASKPNRRARSRPSRYRWIL